MQLLSMYLGGSNIPQGSWTVIGLGLRLAQDMGAHRKKVYDVKPTVESELMKRAFWCVAARSVYKVAMLTLAWCSGL